MISVYFIECRKGNSTKSSEQHHYEKTQPWNVRFIFSHQIRDQTVDREKQEARKTEKCTTKATSRQRRTRHKRIKKIVEQRFDIRN